MAKIQTDSLYATIVSGTTIQSENFNFTGSLVLSNNLLVASGLGGTLDLGEISEPFSALYTHAISSPTSSTDLQINSSNGGDIRFTFNGSTEEWRMDDTTGNLVGMNGTASIRHNLDNSAVQICGGSSEDQSLGARVAVFGESSVDPGAIRLYSSDTNGRPIRFYNDGTLRWNMINGHFSPNSNSVYDIGAESTNCRFVYTNVVVNSITSNALDISSTNGGGIQFALNGTGRLFIDESGNLRPNTNGAVTLGTSTHRFSTVYANAFSSNQAGADVSLIADDDIVFTTGGVNRWVIFDPGVLRPNVDSTYDIGTSATKCLRVYSDSFLNFTGIHLFKIKAGESLSSGDAVCIENQEVKKCTVSEHPACIGVVVETRTAQEIDTTDENCVKDSFRNEYTVSGSTLEFASVAQCGDNYTNQLTGFKVCDENGPISAGDFLCTASGHPGYLKKWTPNVNTLNAIVGKSYEDVTFSGGIAENVYGTLQG